jgi:hypothetical protein
VTAGFTSSRLIRITSIFTRCRCPHLRQISYHCNLSQFVTSATHLRYIDPAIPKGSEIGFTTTIDLPTRSNAHIGFMEPPISIFSMYDLSSRYRLFEVPTDGLTSRVFNAYMTRANALYGNIKAVVCLQLFHEIKTVIYKDLYCRNRIRRRRVKSARVFAGSVSTISQTMFYLANV